MNDLWMNFALEIGLFSILGIGYYFYQKRKIIHFEENKNPIIINYILEICLAEKTESKEKELDDLIIELDDYLNQKKLTPPIKQLRDFSESTFCSPRLKEVIQSSLKEIENE
jgi:hypothetical protein